MTLGAALMYCKRRLHAAEANKNLQHVHVKKQRVSQLYES